MRELWPARLAESVRPVGSIRPPGRTPYGLGGHFSHSHVRKSRDRLCESVRILAAMEWLTIEQAAQVAGTHKSTLYRQVQAIKNTAHVRKMGRRMQVSRAWVDANSRESPRKTVRKSHAARQAPPEAARGRQTAPDPDPYDHMAADELLREIRARIADKDAEIARLIDRVNRLEEINLEKDRIIGTMALGQASPRKNLVVLEAANIEDEPPAPDPRPADPQAEPRADLVAWLKAVKAAQA